MASDNPWMIRSAIRDDSPIIAQLLDQAHWVHQHLDWLDAETFLDRSPFLLALYQNELIACIACPLSLHHVAWIRVFAVAPNYDPRQLWEQLWPPAFKELQSIGCKKVAALVISPWFEPLLLQSEFKETNAVIFLEWLTTSPPSSPPFTGELRGLRDSDIDPLIELDHKAFLGIWSNPRDELLEAFKSASIATVLEFEDKLIGYQISTASAWGAHLARLAVHPDYQGKGIGNAIVTDLMQQVRKRGYHRLTVNTQADNLRSLSLYRRLGFMETGDRYPVLERIIRN
jgi:ribosomal-protein-alanine N-acetyltransferase